MRRPSPQSLSVCLLATSVAAASPALALDPFDRNEHRFGATYLSAQSGNGALTVGVGPLGEIPLLSWPSPSFHDLVDFETEASATARSLPFFGAQETEGVFGGLRLRASDGSESFTWLRDPAWAHHQSYASDTSAAVEHTFTHAALGLVVTQWTTVDPDRDVVLRRTRLARDAASTIVGADYVLYANLAPTATRAPEGPAQDDARGDFAAYWDLDSDAVVHFRPGGDRADLAALDSVLGTSWAFEGAWRSGLEDLRELQATFGDGAAVAVGGVSAPDAFHIGSDTDTPCEDDRGWAWAPESAFDAAMVPDGLTGSPVAGCRANFALSWSSELGPVGADSLAAFDTYFAVGPTPSAALVTLAEARVAGFDDGRARADAVTEALLADRLLPDHDDLGPGVLAFARRALIALHQGTDARTGAAVSSIATQPALHLDRPRDSVFLDLARDVAGAFDAVSDHKQFLTDHQAKDPVLAGPEGAEVLHTPPGAWAAGLYADGRPGTAPTAGLDFAIDDVGLALWGYWAHAAYATNDGQARGVLASAWPAIERGANLLAACLDADHPALDGAGAGAGMPSWWPAYEALSAGTIPDPDARAAAMAAGDWEALRPCAAREDDRSAASVSLYSTHVARMGLLAAARTARALCVDDARSDYWDARAHELGAVAFQLYFTDGVADAPGTWTDDPEVARTDWILWPEELSIDPSLDVYFEDRVGPTGGTVELRAAVEAFTRDALDDYAFAASEASRAAVALEAEGATHVAKQTLSLARYWDLHPRSAGRLADGNVDTIRALVDLATPGTGHLGEAWVNIDDDGDGGFDRADQRTGTPHLPTEALTYLSAMAVAAPERFAFEGAVLGPYCEDGVEPRLFRETPSCNCDDTSTEAQAQAAAAILFAVLLPALARRRRR